MEGYRPVGERPGAQAKYAKIGMLYPDGSFERRQSANWRYSKAEMGMFECGIFVLDV